MKKKAHGIGDLSRSEWSFSNEGTGDVFSDELLKGALDPTGVTEKIEKVPGGHVGFFKGETVGEQDAEPFMNRPAMWKQWAKAIDEESERFETARGLIDYMLKHARVFRVPPEIEDDAQAIVSAMGGSKTVLKNAASMWDTFVLPFRACALFTPNQSVVFAAKVNPAWSGGADFGAEPSAGVHGVWVFVVLMPQPKVDASVRRPETGELLVTSTATVGAVVIREDGIDEGGDISFDASVFEMIGTDESGELRLLYSHSNAEPAEISDTRIRDLAIENIGKGASMALDFFVSVQHPKNFIVELSPEAPEKPRKKGAKLKHPNRARGIGTKPVYLSLTPATIRRTLGLAEPEVGANAKRRPHERRAHLRRLSSERFKWKRGELVPVRGSWIGPTSGKTPDGREYRIRTDIASPHVATDTEKPLTGDRLR